MSADFKLSVAAAVLSFLLFPVAGSAPRRVIGGLLSGTGALIVALPTPAFLGICELDSLACHRTTHWLAFWGAGLFVIGLFISFVGRREPIAAVPPDPWDESPGAAHQI
jgi:uncharacterized membrane protein YGL010W